MKKIKITSPELRSNIIEVEYLYLDLNVCKRCISTDQVLEKALRVINPALELAGFKVKYSKVEIADSKMAIDKKFLSSPTIRVNGTDICGKVEENSCGCCSDISSTEVDCRVFTYKGKKFEVPPEEMIANSILETIFNKEKEHLNNDEYSLPENLKNFFEGKDNNEN